MRQKDREQWFIIPDHHTAIVDRNTFDAAHKSATRFKLPVKKTHEYPLKGKIFCGFCHHALSRTSNKTVHYLCRHTYGIEGAACNGLKIHAAELEDSIFDTLKRQVALIFPDGVADLAHVPNEQVSVYEQQLSDLREEKMRLYERYVSGELDVDSYRSEKAEVDKLILKAKNAYSVVTAKAKQAKEQHDRLVQRNQIVREVADADRLTQRLTDLMIDRVYVYPDRRIEINYKINDIFSDVT